LPKTELQVSSITPTNSDTQTQFIAITLPTPSENAPPYPPKYHRSTLLDVIALAPTRPIAIRLMQISVRIPPHALAATLLDRASWLLLLLLLLVLRWLLIVALLRWWTLWLLLLLLLLLIVAQSFEAFMGDAEHGAVFDAVFDETHAVFFVASGYTWHTVVGIVSLRFEVVRVCD
jgi:hypothetical protein